MRNSFVKMNLLNLDASVDLLYYTNFKPLTRVSPDQKVLIDAQ